jgi:hypothetical protein
MLKSLAKKQGDVKRLGAEYAEPAALALGRNKIDMTVRNGISKARTRSRTWGNIESLTGETDP